MVFIYVTNGVTVCGTAFGDLPVASLHCKTVRFDPFFSFSGVQSLRSTQSSAQEHYRGNEVSQVVQCSWPQQAAPFVAEPRGFLFTLLCPNILLQFLFIVTRAYTRGLVTFCSYTLLEILWLFIWTRKRCSTFTSAFL